jgi:hypothetical protein
MRFLSNIHDPQDPNAKIYLTLNYWEAREPGGREAAWQRHLEWVNAHVIGEPQASSFYTSEQLKEMGMVGVYARE